MDKITARKCARNGIKALLSTKKFELSQLKHELKQCDKGTELEAQLKERVLIKQNVVDELDEALDYFTFNW